MFEQLLSTCLSNSDAQSGSLFMLLLNTLVASQCALSDLNLYPPDKSATLKNGDHFDLIVIGAGSAGSVAGSRLVETGKWKVLVVEAGGIPSTATEIPALFVAASLGDQTWKYQAEPSEQSCLGLINGTSFWPRGKELGGCSSINTMLYIRGNKRDFNNWAKQSSKEWDYENVVEYFEKTEKLLAKDLQHLDSYGKKGLLPLTKHTAKDAIRNVLLEAAREEGNEILEGEGGLGFFDGVQNIYMGTRANAAKVFLGSVKNSNKLTLSINTYVRKIIIDKKKKQADGVELMIGDESMNIFADKEVILSAGTLNSPQILMLSGIGPKEHLRELGIEVIQDLRVGENLQDHLMFFIASKLNDEATIPTVLEDELYKYFAHREGAFSNIGVSNIHGFVNTKNDSAFPDIQYQHLVLKKNDTNSLDSFMRVLNMNSKVQHNLRNALKEHNIFLMLIVLLQPKSRGKLLLRSDDPHLAPIFRSGYLTDENGEDLATLLSGVRVAQSILKTKVFKRLDAEIMNYGVPNCADIKFDTDEYWKCAIRNLGTTFYHLTSTCKMGLKEDKEAVVDERLKVYGIKNLRVVDASIMPQVTSGNTNAPTMMIGQKGAQMIIDDHNGEDKDQEM